MLLDGQSDGGSGITAPVANSIIELGKFPLAQRVPRLAETSIRQGHAHAGRFPPKLEAAHSLPKPKMLHYARDLSRNQRERLIARKFC